MEKPIHKHSFKYILLRSHVDFIWHLFYRKFTIIGKENVPKNEAVIFSVNHQNTLMDALAVLFALKGQPVFMARADIFKKKTAAAFLRFVKIIPIFRIRDGIKSLSNNDDSFNQAVATLQDRERLIILPEGTHLGQRRLRALKKGLARIAFQCEVQNNFKLGLKIIPTGLDYSHYINFKSDLLVQFGKPIMVSDYKDLYEENEQKAMHKLMEDIRERMIPLMLHIDDVENYEAIEYSTLINYAKARFDKNIGKSQLEKVNYQQKVSDKLLSLKESNNSEFETITNKALNVKKALAKFNLRLWVLTKEKYSSLGILLNILLLLLGVPIFILGTVFNAIPFFLPVRLSKGVKDPQFKSTFRFVIASVLIAIVYLLYAVVMYNLINYPILVTVILVLGIPLGLFAFGYYTIFKKTMAKIRVNKLRKNIEWQNVVSDYNDVGLLQ